MPSSEPFVTRERDVAVEPAPHLAQVLPRRHEVQAHVARARDVLRAEQILAERREIHVVEVLLDVHARRIGFDLHADVAVEPAAIELRARRQAHARRSPAVSANAAFVSVRPLNFAWPNFSSPRASSVRSTSSGRSTSSSDPSSAGASASSDGGR